jgi:hypothetical protein
VVLIAEALLPPISTAADMDPASFINNLDKQLQAVSSRSSPEQKMAGFRALLGEDFDFPGLGRVFSDDFGGFSLRQSSRNSWGCLRISLYSPIEKGCWGTQMAAVVQG